jgi:RNA polymerase sigma-70 factor (ECF subfamily)
MSAIAYCSMNAMEADNSTIARGLRRRDPELLDRLIEEYQHRLLGYLVYLTGNRELAKDLFQETWIHVLERGHQYDGRRKFSTWLYAIARNLTIDYFRKKSPVSLDGLMEDEQHRPLEPMDPRPQAWERVAQREQAERVNAALLNIPAQYRETVALRFKDDLSLEEIAAVIGTPLGTVKSRLHRGLNLLMGQLKETQA